MPNYRVDLEYDGSRFHGWQAQPGETRTVQGELQCALATLCGTGVRVVGAGRTDAGVHALGQVASFKIEEEKEPQRFLRGLNALLPCDVRAHRLQIVPDDFSARTSALWRRYAHALPGAVDVQAMAAATAFIVGDHDFTAFARSDSAGVDRCCRVLDAHLDTDTHLVRFEITANRFLHNMVRRLAGAIVEVGRGRFVPGKLAEILQTGDTSRGGPCLPACGLFLLEVRYPDDSEDAGGPAPVPARLVDAGPGAP